MRAADLSPALRRKLLGEAPKPKGIAKVPAANEGEDLFRFQCRAAKLPHFEAQYQFAKSMGRGFLADFAWPRYSLLIEINGGVWRKGGGAHSRPAKIIADMERYQHMALLDYFCLPFTPDEVFSGHAINWTERVLRNRGWTS